MLTKLLYQRKEINNATALKYITGNYFIDLI